MHEHTRRAFLRDLGVGAAALPFVTNLSFGQTAPAQRRQRLVIIFSPNGVVPNPVGEPQAAGAL